MSTRSTTLRDNRLQANVVSSLDTTPYNPYTVQPTGLHVCNVPAIPLQPMAPVRSAASRRHSEEIDPEMQNDYARTFVGSERVQVVEQCRAW